jgi:hypothetical protein
LTVGRVNESREVGVEGRGEPWVDEDKVQRSCSRLHRIQTPLRTQSAPGTATPKGRAVTKPSSKGSACPLGLWSPKGQVLSPSELLWVPISILNRYKSHIK